jgi:membrane protein implicated in regulation of membrane protease activity
MLLGDFILVWGLAIWMTVAVGPWYIGIILMLASLLLNSIIQKAIQRRVQELEEQRQDGLEQIKKIITESYNRNLEDQ